MSQLTPEAIARRALCLGVVVLRGQTEYLLEQSADSELIRFSQERMDKVATWMRQEGLDGDLSGIERAILGKALGTWTVQEVIDAAWRAEALGTPLWALSLSDAIPAYDSEFADASSLGLLWNRARPVQDFLKQSNRRSEAEIGKARDIAELWHWRANTARLTKGEVALPRGWTQEQLAKIIKDTATKAGGNGDIPAPIDGDFPAFGKAYRNLTDEEHAMATSIAVERQYALNWLSGYAVDWDDVRTDT